MAITRQVRSTQQVRSTTRWVGLSLWLIFLGSFITQSSPLSWFHDLSVHGGGVLLILLSLRYLKYLPTYIKLNRGYWLLYPMLVICFLGTLLGIARGANYKVLIAYAFLPYAGAFLILLSAQKEIRQRLIPVLRLQLTLATIFAFYVAFTSRSLTRDQWFAGPEATAYRQLLLVPFFVGFAIGHGKWKTLLIATSGYLALIIVILQGVHRAASITSFIVMPLAALAVSMRYGRLSQRFSTGLKIIALISIMLGVSFLVVPDVSSRLGLNTSWSELLFRFSGYESWAGLPNMEAGAWSRLAHEVGYSRGAEAQDFLHSLSTIEYVTGKGFGIGWYSSFWGKEWPIVHIGPLHLVLRGGIPLLVTYLLLLLFALKSSWENAREDPVAMGCFVYLLVWTVQWFSYGAYSSSYYLYVFWLVVGLALSKNDGFVEYPLSNKAQGVR